ncbi:MAG TPA: DEAD/DEAH box helicase [Bryobacteraceae bacterium]|nr:DEAD/DEAH box helicase [Bryobacteraceae bacterium]
MLILHASFSKPHLLLWGETAERPAGPDELTAIVKPFADAAQKTKIRARNASAWLPSFEGRPVPSHRLLGDAPPREAVCELVVWPATVLRMEGGHWENFLAACSSRRQVGQNLMQPGVLIGDDLAFWADALQFAWSLVARQQFLPSLIETGIGYEARWRPIFAGDDAQRLRNLAQSMPPSGRAIAPDAKTQPAIPAKTVLAQFLQSTVDRLVRETTLPPTTSKTSIHDKWLAALHSPHGVLIDDRAKLQSLAKSVRDWQRPIELAANAPFRLCFRMREPGPDEREDRWHVEYMMQSVTDPSLLLPASEIWRAKGREAHGVFGASAREHLMLSLGQAAGIAPKVEESLRRREPGGIEFNTLGAHEFLQTTARVLEQNGFGVQLPSWWTRRDLGQRLRVHAVVKTPMHGTAGLSMDSIIEFEWQVALGETILTLDDLRTLAKLKAPLVKIRGQWIQVNAIEIQAAIEFLQRKSTKGTLADAIRMSIGAVSNTFGALPVDHVSGTGWVSELLKKLEGDTPFEELETPQKLEGTLRPYQKKGYSWLDFLTRWGLGACLADDMGLGKTIQTLALIQYRKQENKETAPALLVCPTSVVGNWQKESARFTPDLRVMVHHGSDRRKGKAFAAEAKSHDIVLSTYSLLPRDFEVLKDVKWDGVILDEAQNIKNPETKQARAAMALVSGYRIALTGTPVENNVGDLWSIFEFLNPGLLGNQADFKKNFFQRIQVQRDPEAAERLKKTTGPFILRRLKTDKSIIADLPDKLEMKVYCNLTKEQASLYAAIVRDVEGALASSSGIERKGLVLATLSKLKQVCNHPAQFLKDKSPIAGRSGKLARLSEMLEEVLSVGDRALVFTQFVEMGQMLKQHIEESFGREVLFLHGSVPKKQRDEMVERFGDAEGPPVFLLSLKAGGIGLNLTGANHVFHFDRWWNPAVENQATDRAFRIGQTKNVQVHKFVCAGTLEEKIDGMIERKKDVAERVIGAGEAWLTELSNDELRDLLALREDAIGDE